VRLARNADGRECEVMAVIAIGLLNKRIAAGIGHITEKTRRQVVTTMEASSRPDFAPRADSPSRRAKVSALTCTYDAA
jgi:FixJ family two-component response regulator